MCSCQVRKRSHSHPGAEGARLLEVMSRIGRADRDLGVRAGYAKVHELDEYPTAKRLEPLGDVYGPWRSAAAWYCYRVLETELP